MPSSSALSVYRRPYLDSSVFIAWIKGEVVAGINRAEIVAHILDQAKDGLYKVYISSVTLAEVHKQKGKDALSEKQDIDLLQYFEHSFFEVVQVDRKIGEDANKLCREYALTPMDAIHLSCALRANCDFILAWDKHLTRVVHPSITACEPEKLGQHKLDL